MPKIAEKVKVLNGRGAVVRFASGTSKDKYFYKELVKGTKSYKTRLIEGATTLDEALEKVIDIAFEINQDKPNETIKRNIERKNFEDKDKGVVKPKKRRTQISLAKAIDSFIRKEELRATSKVIKYDTVDNKKRILGVHLKKYFEHKGLKYTSEIKVGVLNDYIPYRKKVGTPSLMLQNEIKMIKDWVMNYLYINELINPYIANDKKLFPRVEVRPDDLLKNPAITQEDWRTIIDYVRNIYIKRKRGLVRHPRASYTAYCFWHFLLLGKNTGMDKEELLKLKWKNIETIDRGRTNSEGEQVEWLETYIFTTRSKTGVSREIPCNQGRELRRLLGIQRGYIKRHKLGVVITPDSLVFGNVFEDMRPFSGATFHHMFRKEIFLPLKAQGKIKGHKFSPHDYTIKSLRSTFIEDKLRKKTDIFLLSRIAGHDPKMLMRHYEKMDIRTRASEILIDTDKFNEVKPSKGKKVDLLTEDQEED